MSMQSDNPSQTNLATTVLNIAQLPSSPTPDWSSDAAQALSPSLGDTHIGVVIAFCSRELNTISVELTGTNHISSANAGADQMRSSLERLSNLAINIPSTPRHSAYIAPVSRLIPSWYATKASLPWTSPHETTTIAGYAQLESPQRANTESTDSDSPDLAMIVLARPKGSTTIDLPNFSAAFAALAYKASSTIHPVCGSTEHARSIPWLTQREQVILDHLIEGESVRVIAELVDRSPHTVHDHVKNLHRKLCASSRGQLIARALGNTASSKPINLINPEIDPVLFEHADNRPPAGLAEIKPQPGQLHDPEHQSGVPLLSHRRAVE